MASLLDYWQEKRESVWFTTRASNHYLSTGVMSSIADLYVSIGKHFSTVQCAHCTVGFPCIHNRGMIEFPCILMYNVHVHCAFICLKFWTFLARNSSFDISFVTGEQPLREQDTDVMSKQSPWYKRSPRVSKEISEQKTCKYSKCSK